MTTRCDCGCPPGVPQNYQTLSEHEKQMMWQGYECDWCPEPATLVEHNHATNHVRGVACSQHNAWWRGIDAERYGTSFVGRALLAVGRAVKRMREGVRNEINRLEFEQFRQPEDRHRLMEIRQLAIEQLRDDNYESLPERHGAAGRYAVYRQDRDPGDEDMYEMWWGLDDEQRALQVAMEPLLDAALTSEQRMVVRARYYGHESLEAIAKHLRITKTSVSDRLKVIHKRVRKALIEAFGEPPDTNVDWRD